MTPVRMIEGLGQMNGGLRTPAGKSLLQPDDGFGMGSVADDHRQDTAELNSGIEVSRFGGAPQGGDRLVAASAIGKDPAEVGRSSNVTAIRWFGQEADGTFSILINPDPLCMGLRKNAESGHFAGSTRFLRKQQRTVRLSRNP